MNSERNFHRKEESIIPQAMSEYVHNVGTSTTNDSLLEKYDCAGLFKLSPPYIGLKCLFNT